MEGSHVGAGISHPAVATMVRAAQYVRMSTEHQQYSTENQADAIQRYAERRGIVIVRTYADEGKSGLSLDGRDALKRLIVDVQSGNTDFTTIRVYDVSRWSRFQDADESAYYEYIVSGPEPAVAGAANGPQPEIQAARFKSQVNSAKLLGRTGCEHHNTNPRFQPGGSESTLICLRIGLLSLVWGDQRTFGDGAQPEEPYAE